LRSKRLLRSRCASAQSADAADSFTAELWGRRGPDEVTVGRKILLVLSEQTLAEVCFME
jgi:hypothetical protein